MLSKIESSNPTATKIDRQRKLLLFDLNHTGHHAGYIENLVRYWQQNNLEGRLYILVSPTFIKCHNNVVELSTNPKIDNVNFIAISPEEELTVSSDISFWDRTIRGFNQWKILVRYAKKLKIDSCLIMYFDSLQFPLSLGLPFPCDLSGIYFRPVFHYSTFNNFQATLRERFWQWRDKLFLARILKHQKFKNLFCLDPFVVDPIEKFNNSVSTLQLSDPVHTYEDTQVQTSQFKQSLGIEPEEKVFLMFGAYRRRKGMEELLSAIELLQQNLVDRFCLLLVGPVSAEPHIKARIEEIQQQSGVKIVINSDFVPDCEIQPYFQISDVILAPYQRHIGMSAILVRAAAAQKPVLSSNYGLMGELVKRYKLGIAVDTEIPAEIARGLSQFIEKSPKDFTDLEQMKHFALKNTPEKFAATIFNNMGK